VAHELASCTKCALHHTRQRVVIGSGPLNARLMVVGEAPGRAEDEGGAPFIGRSGQLLVRLIAEELGLTRDEYFITNVVKCRPPKNRTPSVAEATTCQPWLDQQIATQQPSYLLAVGATAARYALGLVAPMREIHGVASLRGDVVGLATYHPAAALRGGPNVVAVMRADLTIVRGLLGL